jgi:outer membrane immunogenic protein
MTISRFLTLPAAKRLALPLIALGACLAVPAHAQSDDSTYDRSNDAGPRYNGVYIAGGVGATMQPSDRNDTLVFDRANNGQFGNALPTSTGANAFAPGFCHGAFTSSTAGNCTPDRNRPDYSVKIGVDSRSGNFVAGLLVEGQINRSVDYTSAFSTTPAAYQIARRLDYNIALRGRLGFTPDNGGGLFYVTGGVGYARLQHTFTTTNGLNQFTSYNDKKGSLSAQIGGGAEVMVTPHVGLGIEYLYNHFRDRKYGVAVTQGTAPATNPFLLAGGQTNIQNSNPNFNMHTVRAVVAYHF